MYLLDTSTIIEFFRKNQSVIDKLYILSKENTVSVSAFSLAELYYGAEKSDNKKENQEKIELFVDKLGIIVQDFSKETANSYGFIYSSLEKLGKKIPILDAVICATSLQYQTKILTKDKKHFLGLERYGIKVEVLES